MKQHGCFKYIIVSKLMNKYIYICFGLELFNCNAKQVRHPFLFLFLGLHVNVNVLMSGVNVTLPGGEV